MPLRARKAGVGRKPQYTTAQRRGYTAAWKRARARFIVDKPYCSACGLVASPAHVDHIKPHRGNDELFWDESNWQGFAPLDKNDGAKPNHVLCAKCHGIKTARGE